MTTAKTRKQPVYKACFENLQHLLKGEISYAEWERRQEELESRLTPEPELPLTEKDNGGTPKTKKAA